MSDLTKVKEALELIYNPNDFVTNESISPQEIQDKFKEALAELNKHMERLDSEELVEEIQDAVKESLNDYYMSSLNLNEIRTKCAQAVVNFIKGESQ